MWLCWNDGWIHPFTRSVLFSFWAWTQMMVETLTKKNAICAHQTLQGEWIFFSSMPSAYVMALMSVLGAYKSTEYTLPHQRLSKEGVWVLIWCFVEEWACFSHTKSHGYTQITKPKFKHGKWECAENKTSMFALLDSHIATGFLMEKHISTVKPSQLGSFSLRLRPQCN